MPIFGMWYLKNHDWMWFEKEYDINGPEIKVSDFPDDVKNYLDRVWNGECLKGPDPILIMDKSDNTQSSGPARRAADLIVMR